jgi:UDP-GlcNAc3NAcA epimerase
VKVCTILGTRPQFIKASVVSRVLAARRHVEVLVDTGQHVIPAMSGDLIDELGLRPDYRFSVAPGSRAAQIASMTATVGEVLDTLRPDWVVVLGDTNSTLAGARAAHARGLPLAHIEAGTRSYNETMPEEQNRIETDRLSTLLLCSTPRASRQLAAEGQTRGVHIVGDVMLDAMLHSLARSADTAGSGETCGLPRHGYVVATLHRVATTDAADRLRRVVEALERLPLPVVFPMHPRTRERLGRLGRTPEGSVRVLPPLGHAAMLRLVASAHALVTDSGGLQKEAYWLGVPCVTFRSETEWPETIEAGWNTLVGEDPGRIAAAVAHVTRPEPRLPILGEPGAGARVVELLETAP